MTQPAATARDHASRVVQSMPGQRLLVTGASGFVGSSVLALLDACGASREGWSVTCLARRRPAATTQLPRGLAVRWIAHDVRAPWAEIPAHDLVLHAATATGLASHTADLTGVATTAYQGTLRLVEWARQHGHRPRIVHTSSGAVYAPPASRVQRATREDAPTVDLPAGDPVDYATAKRAAESVLDVAHDRGEISRVNARLFAFLGPHQPTNGHHAITSFLRDASAGRPVRITGTGRVVRSYLYEEDMAAWLVASWAASEGIPAVNIGSRRALTLSQVAEEVAAAFGTTVEILGDASADGARQWYVPDTRVAQSVLAVSEWTDLPSAILRTRGAWAAEAP